MINIKFLESLKSKLKVSFKFNIKKSLVKKRFVFGGKINSI